MVNLFYSNGDWFARGFAVRPVVYLNSEATVEDLHIIDGQEDNWSTYNNSDSQAATGEASNGLAGNR
ncbi:unknown [Clostridium sp. CAG:780]|nr:unknown [Clostridium sp. CAG:780]